MRALILIGGLALIGLGTVGVVYAAGVFDAALKRRRSRRARIEDFQDEASLEALKRTQDRINRAIDQQ